jgi:hypothetical protein
MPPITSALPFASVTADPYSLPTLISGTLDQADVVGSNVSAEAVIEVGSPRVRPPAISTRPSPRRAISGAPRATDIWVGADQSARATAGIVSATKPTSATRRINVALTPKARFFPGDKPEGRYLPNSTVQVNPRSGYGYCDPYGYGYGIRVPIYIYVY